MANNKTSGLIILPGEDLVATDRVVVLDRSATTGPGSGPEGTLKTIEADRVAPFGTTKGIVRNIQLTGIDTTQSLLIWVAEAINTHGPYAGEVGQDLYFRTYQVTGGTFGQEIGGIGSFDSVTIMYFKLLSGALIAGGVGNTVSHTDLVLAGGPYEVSSESNSALFLEIGDAGAGPIQTYFNQGDNGDPWIIDGQQFLTGTMNGESKLWHFLAGDGHWGGTSGNNTIADDFVDLSAQPPALGFFLTKIHYLSLVGVDLNQNELEYIAEAVGVHGPFTCLRGQQMVFKTVTGNSLEGATERYYRLIPNYTSVGGTVQDAVPPHHSWFMPDGQNIVNIEDPDIIVELGDIGFVPVEDAFNQGDNGAPWDMNVKRFVRATYGGQVTLWAFVGVEGFYGGNDMGTDPDILEAFDEDFWNIVDDYSEYLIDDKSAIVTVEDSFTHTEGEPQIFTTDYKVHQLHGCFLNGQRLINSQIDIRSDGYEVLIPLEGVNEIVVQYETKTIPENIHGFQFDISIPAPEVQRIGNAALNQSLPIQSKLRRCLLLDDGTVNYYLNENDSTKKENGIDDAILDGTDGQVMVEKPRYWYRDTQENGIRKYLMSETPFLGATESPKFYVSAYKAAINRLDNKLSSVVNHTADYRGGNNQSAWDSENIFKSQIGKPVTVTSRINFRNYAKNRGANWYEMDIEAREVIAWLITHEYGTRNHQSAISIGPVYVDSNRWNDFNSRYPLFQCGLTNSLGNNTGEISITLSDFPIPGESDTTQVFSYRGIENFWGDIWEWTNAVNVFNDKFYQNPKGRKNISNTAVDGYVEIGDIPIGSGYIKEMYPGTIMPKEIGGSSSTYYADRFYAVSNPSVFRGLLFGGPSHGGAGAGSFDVDSLYAPSYASARVGSRLCFFKR